jgi:uncharacterized protein DUF6680
MATVQAAFGSLKFSDILTMLILIATIFAIYLGPIRAVEISRRNDVEREASRRRREIFASLMRTRNAALTPDHVWAINLVQVEFGNDENVIRTYKSYMAILAEVLPEPGPALSAFLQKRRDLFFDLLHEIAKAVGFNLDKRDLDRAGYVPIGWEAEQNEMRLFRQAMIELLSGKRGLPITQFVQQGGHNPYPPPPGGSANPPPSTVRAPNAPG